MKVNTRRVKVLVCWLCGRVFWWMFSHLARGRVFVHQCITLSLVWHKVCWLSTRSFALRAAFWPSTRTSGEATFIAFSFFFILWQMQSYSSFAIMQESKFFLMITTLKKIPIVYFKYEKAMKLDGIVSRLMKRLHKSLKLCDKSAAAAFKFSLIFVKFLKYSGVHHPDSYTSYFLSLCSHLYRKSKKKFN